MFARIGSNVGQCVYPLSDAIPLGTGIKACDGLTVEPIKRLAIVIEERADFGWHGRSPNERR